MSFASLAAKGYGSRLIPIIPPLAPISERSNLFKRIAAGDDARGKSPGVRWPDGRWSGFDWRAHQTIDADLIRWDAMRAGVGVKLDDGLVAIDADTLDEGIARIIKEIMEKWLGICPVRIGRYPKALYLVRTSAPYRYARIEFGHVNGGPRERVEILSTGKQFVAEGVHPFTGQPYLWPQGVPDLASLPLVAPATLDGLMADLRAALPEAGAIAREGVGPEGVEIDQASLRGEPDLVRAAVEALTSANTTENFPSRESYLSVGYRIKASLPDDLELAFSLFSGWCADWRDPDGRANDPEIVAGDWARMKGPFRRGAESLYRLAQEMSGGAFNAVALIHHEKLIEEAPPLFPPDEVATKPEISLLGTPYCFLTADDIEPREFLYGSHYQREYASVTIAPTKIGKSSLGLVEAMAMASGKPLLGIQPEGVFRVRIWNGEDPQNEMDRRLLAVRQHFGITPEDIGDRLFVDSGRDQPLAIAHMTPAGAKIYEPVSSAVRKALALQKIDVLFIDPFVKSHAVSENDNMAIDVVVKEWNLIAGQARIALELVHHSRKLNGSDISIEDSRGGSSLVSGARAARVLARMTEKQSRTLGRTKDYKSLFRIADAANNMAAAIVGEDEIWYELVSVDIRNARFDANGKQIRKSDKVGVATLSKTRGQGVEERAATPERINQEAQALAALASGTWKDGVKAGSAWAGLPIAAAFGLDIDDLDQKAEAKAILASLIAQKKIVKIPKTDKNRNSRIFIEVVKLPEVDLFG